jgi:hypothetical protein
LGISTKAFSLQPQSKSAAYQEVPMTKLSALLIAGAFAITATTAFAADDKKTAAAEPKAANSQQNKMKECQAQAGEKKLEGKDRQDFVNKCLKATPAKAEPAKAESKMAMCNKKTAGLKGDERSKAQSQSMKGS